MSEKINRTKLLQAYLENQTEFLKTIFGDEEIQIREYQEFIKEKVRSQICRPIMQIIKHEHYGSAELKEVDLLEFSNATRSKIITPSGSIYQTVNEKTSLLKQFISDLLKQRKIVKNKMLDAEAKGDHAAALLYKNEQATIKINTNSLIGAMGSPFNCFYDLAGFNSVTSVSRQSIMTAYTHTERLLEGNFYFPNNDIILNHLVLLKKYCPNQKYIIDTLSEFKLFLPEMEHVIEFIYENKKIYSNEELSSVILKFLSECTQAELCWFYYYDNLKHLFRTDSNEKCTSDEFYLTKNNSNFFKKYIANLFDETIDESMLLDDKISSTDIKKLDIDLVILMGNSFNDLLENRNIFKLDKEHPALAKRMYLIGKKLEDKLNHLWKLIKLFTDTKINIPAVMESKNIIRKAVIVSDTDSVIFSTKHWIKWFTGNLKITGDAFKINALIVYILTKTTEYVLNVSTNAFGALGKDVQAIAMKNELLYQIYMNTTLKKHYIGDTIIQEGRWLPKGKRDIKGGQLRGSFLPKNSLDFIEKFVFDIFDSINEGIKIPASNLILTIIAREQYIMKSLENGELTFLENEPIKTKEAYELPESSIYWNYEMWQNVFAYKFGDINIPSKSLVIPVHDNLLRSKKYNDYLNDIDATLNERLQEFLLYNKKKKITRILLNPMLPNIPKEFLPIINSNSIIYTNCSPLYIVMRSAGLAIGNEKNKYIFTELYM